MTDTVTVSVVSWILLHLALVFALIVTFFVAVIHLVTLARHNAVLIAYAQMLYNSIPLSYRQGVATIGQAFTQTGDLFKDITGNTPPLSDGTIGGASTPNTTTDTTTSVAAPPKPDPAVNPASNLGGGTLADPSSTGTA